MVDFAQSRLQRLLGALQSRSALLGQTGWVAAAFGLQQGMRLILNIVLARLLAPELFGVMMLLNTFRTGAELLSDIGIGQNIIRNPKGEEPDFLNTAWVLSITRGIIVCALAFVAAGPVAQLYNDPQLNMLIPAMGLLFLIVGFQAPSRNVLEKRMNLKKIAGLELVIGLVSIVVHIALAWVMPTIWALVISLLIMSFLTTLASYTWLPGHRWRLRMKPEYTREILSFGKWIFASSFIFFLSLNFDRLYFAKEVSAVTLGVYGIARTYSDTAVLLVQKVSAQIVFPKVAASGQQGAQLHRNIAPTRKLALLAIAGALAFGVAISDVIIGLLYDDRYRDVATYLPVLLLGAWFTVLAAFAEGMLLGVGRSRSVAYANALKLVWIVITIPWSLHHFGMKAAPFAFILGDAVRYAVLSWEKRRAEFSFIAQDVGLTALFALLVVLFRELTGLIGITDGLAGWFTALTALQA